MGPAHPPPPQEERALVWGWPGSISQQGWSFWAAGITARSPSPPHTHGKVQRKPLCLSNVELAQLLSQEKMLSPILPPCSSLHHHPRCHPSSCPSWQPLLLFGDCHCPSQSHLGRGCCDTELCFAALHFHHFLFLSLPGL